MNVCDNCSYLIPLDDKNSYCGRFPPKARKSGVYSYPVIPKGFKACGEYKKATKKGGLK